MSEQSRLMTSLAEQQRAAERVAARLRRSCQALVAALSRRDIALLMEKLGVIDAADTWSELALLRNMLAHEYPDRPDKQAQRLNLAYAAATQLLAGLDRLKDYLARKRLLPPTG